MPLSAYDDLLAREARHWDTARDAPREPQIWDDPDLFDVFFGAEWRAFQNAVLAAGRDVLELGCGDGLLACALARRGAAVTGVDLSPVRIARARKHAAEVPGAAPEFLVGDLNTMALPAGRFDVVVAHDALHHILEVQALLDRAAAALRPGGRLVVMEYAGMGRPRRLAAAVLTALLPTHRSWAEKWAMRGRLSSFLATEKARRAAVAAGGGGALHPESPFEEITQEGLLPAIDRRFRILHLHRFNPFWFYLAPKLRLPRRFRLPAARLFRAGDDVLERSGLCRGAYVWLEAEPR